MIRGLRLKNVRSIIDSQMVEIRPITLLVGKNSSGKSTFLRSLPLLKQSVAVDTKEPLLWFSRQGVDFGSYKNVLSRYAKEGAIEISFLFSDLDKITYEVLVTEFGEQMIFSSGGRSPMMLRDASLVQLTCRLTQRTEREGIYISGLDCEIGEDKLEIASAESGLVEEAKFNNIRLDIASPAYMVLDKRGFFPRFARGADEIPQRYLQSRAGGPFMASLLEEVSDLFHGRTSAKKKQELCGNLRFSETDSFFSQLERSFASTVSRLAPMRGTDRIQKMRGQVLLCAMPELTRRASISLRNFCRNVRYVEPVRARAARYYRYQELAVDEIDADGTNVPMFLYSLSERERERLSRWLSEMLGFAVVAQRSSDGHVELFVSEGGRGEKVNLADTGFGYSQVLPVALQLWKSQRDFEKATRPRRSREEILLAVEQPELHLHPEMQALLADLCAATVGASKSAGESLRLIFETHSEHIVNRIGELVSTGRLSTEDVIVYVFERAGVDQPTEIRKVTYEPEGYLSDPWPFGFFIPSPAAPRVDDAD